MDARKLLQEVAELFDEPREIENDGRNALLARTSKNGRVVQYGVRWPAHPELGTYWFNSLVDARRHYIPTEE